MKTKSITIRIPLELYQKYIKIALKKGIEENRIVSFSEIIINAIKNQLKNEQ